MNDNDTRLGRIEERTVAILSRMTAMEKRLDRQYVTQKEFWLVQTIVYGGAGVTLVSVVGALLVLVVK